MVGVIASQTCQPRYHRARAPPHAHDRGDGHHYLPHVVSLTLTGLHQVNEVEDSSLQISLVGLPQIQRKQLILWTTPSHVRLIKLHLPALRRVRAEKEV